MVTQNLSRNLFHSKVNWGAGRLIRYESEGAFTAKFCILNGLTPREFRHFCVSILGHEIDFRTFGKKTISRLSVLLNEDRKVVASLSGDDFALPGVYGSFSFDTHEHAEIKLNEVKYCPECLSYGYHASFHEHYLIQYCPLHLVKLEVVTPSYSSGPTHHDRYIDTVSRLLTKGSEGWLSFATHPIIDQLQESKHFKSYLRWLRKLQLKANQLQGMNILSMIGGAYCKATVGELFKRLSWSIPIPKVVKQIYGIDVGKIEPTVLRFSLSLAKQFQTLLARISYEDLLLLHKILISEAGQTYEFNNKIEQAISEIMLESRHIRSHWAYGNGSWTRSDTAHWPYWGYRNPYVVIAEVLRVDWLKPDKRSHFRVLEKALDIGILRAKPESSPQPRPVRTKNLFLKSLHYTDVDLNQPIPFRFELNLDPEISALLQILFLENAKADVSHSLTWANNVVEGMSPVDAPDQPSIGNFFVTANEGVLCFWRPS